MFTQRELESRLRDAVADATARHTRVKLRDGDGLMLVVRDGGAASWMLQYTIDGQRKEMTLGPWPTVTLKLARDMADAERKRIVHGIDPVALKREAKQVRKTIAASGDTVRSLMVDWLAIKTGSAVYKGNIEAALTKDVLPEIGALRPEQVTRAQIIAILRTIEKRGSLVLLRRVRMWLRQMYEFGIDHEDRPALQASPVPTQHLSSFMAPAHGHFPAITNADELPALVKAILGYGQPVVRFGLLMALHTFTRPTELREATWSEFDLDAARWIIPASRMKMSREHWIPLSPSVVDMLRRHQGVVGAVGWLLPGMKYQKPVSEAALGAALDSLGYKGRQTPHGFRATARTIGEEHLGIDARYLEKQLAHEQKDKVQSAYNRSEYWQERVKLMHTWSAWIDSLI